ncbi:MAG: hypothetical protein AAB787_02520 [Patescibacteria group bacterium]
MKLFSYIIIAVVAIAIIAGFFVLGTPQAERMRKFDDIRVNNLQEIQWQVIGYWQTKKVLPDNLDLLINETQGTRPPVDPETAVAYEYEIITEKDLTFELCATFKTDNSTDQSSTKEGRTDVVYMPYGPGDASWNWQHGLGRACFERTIDPDLYKPNPEVKEIIVQ